MKLAEALRERKQLQIKMGTLRQKLIDNAIYQEVYNSQTQGGGDFDKQGGEQ